MKSFSIKVETLTIGTLIFGYVVGNRGFANIFPVPFIPILPGELGIIICLGFMGLNLLRNKKLDFNLDNTAFVIIIWMILGTVLFLLGFPKYKISAIRDFATVYYVSYFFFAHSIVYNKGELNKFEKFLTAAFLFVAPANLLFQNFPDFVYTKLSVNGVPLIVQKGDLIGVFCAGAFFFFLLKHYNESRRKVFYFFIAFICFVTMGRTLCRAAFLGFFIISLLMIYTKRRFIIKMAGIIGAMIFIPFSIYTILFIEDITETKAYGAYEHIISVTDFSGTRSYKNPDSYGTGDNNRYRLVWWHSLIKETLLTKPFFGYGFGYSLFYFFQGRYYTNLFMDADVRSPHSIILTIFGRMGLAGLFLFLLILYKFGRKTLRCADFSRMHAKAHPAFPYWCMSWCILIGACFGVVLEGPMGAIVYWSVTGIAYGLSCKEQMISPLPETKSDENG